MGEEAHLVHALLREVPWSLKRSMYWDEMVQTHGYAEAKSFIDKKKYEEFLDNQGDKYWKKIIIEEDETERDMTRVEGRQETQADDEGFDKFVGQVSSMMFKRPAAAKAKAVADKPPKGSESPKDLSIKNTPLPMKGKTKVRCRLVARE